MIDNINAAPDYGDEPPFACSSVAVLDGEAFACGGTPGHAGKHRYLIDWDSQGDIAAPGSEPKAATEYPHDDGDFIVIGPECFAMRDGSVLSWRGQNYTPASEPFARPTTDGGMAVMLADEIRHQPVGYQGAAAHTFTTGCDGFHPIGEQCNLPDSAREALDAQTLHDSPGADPGDACPDCGMRHKFADDEL